MNMQYTIKQKITAWILSICLVVTLIPELGYAATDEDSKSESESETTKNETPIDVTEEDVIGKSENVTTYDIGNGEKMSVFHGGNVRFKDESGNLVDYDPSLVAVKKGEQTGNKESLEGYKYKNKTGNKKHFIPENLSEATPVIMENGEYKISFTPTDDTIMRENLQEQTVNLEKKQSLRSMKEKKHCH